MILKTLISRYFLKKCPPIVYLMLYRYTKFIGQMNVALVFALAASLVFTTVKGMLVLA